MALQPYRPPGGAGLAYYYNQYRRYRDTYNQISPYVNRAVGSFRNSTFYGTRGGPNLRGTMAKYSRKTVGTGNRRGSPWRGSNRVYYRKRKRTGYRRRKLRWGTAVRKNALGLFEGKRKLEVIRTTTLASRSLNRTALLGEFTNPTVGLSSGGSLVSSEFAGRECFIRGFKINFLAINSSTAAETDVRIICGWRKINAQPDQDITSATNSIFHIFRNTTNGNGAVELLETAHGTSAAGVADGAVWMLNNAPIDKKVFHVEKDISFRLGPDTFDGEQVFGGNRKKMSFWWDLKNKRWQNKVANTASATVTEVEQNANWFPCMYFYHTPPTVTTSFNVDFLHSWITYYKDPLG